MGVTLIMDRARKDIKYVAGDVEHDGIRIEMMTKPPPAALSFDEKDNMSVYQTAVTELAGLDSAASPEALSYKHLAVLSLARSGATEFAQSEYERYGLTRISAHEDIMALAGRLAKDLFEASGNIEHARDSANFYEAAFQSTSGYYSGINAATMSLIAKVPQEIVMGRAQAVLSRLSAVSGETDEARYFIYASRAEAHYILGDKTSAAAALQAALDFDPLNYTAHASTYRQFRLLAQAHGETMDWLKPLRAPLSVHFAGHLFSKIKDEDSLCVAMSDLIQKEDIGFGYGALAAGSDIIFAEALLEEGGDLHVILPVGVDIFKAASVSALDQKSATNWGARFDSCLERASSIRVLTDYEDWPDADLNNYAARISMGEACSRARTLSSKAGQVLIWDGKADSSLTAHHAQDWQSAKEKLGDGGPSDRFQFIMDFPNHRRAGSSRKIETGSAFTIKTSLAKNGELVQQFDDCSEALAAAVKAMEAGAASDRFGLDIALNRKVNGAPPRALVCEALSRDGLPGSLTVSQDLSAILALEYSSDWASGFTGWGEYEGVKLPAYFAKPLAQ